MQNILFIEKARREYTVQFNKKWASFIGGFNMKYTASKQLYIGNRIRPYLVLWGYALGKESMDPTYYDFCSNLSISLEGIHKASVIVDDIVDGDSKRRGVECLHVEYSEYEAIFFAVCLLAKSVRQINKYFEGRHTSSLKVSAVEILCDTIYDMCAGALMEMDTSDTQRKNLQRIQEIIQLETVALLKNCLLIGFLASESNKPQKEDIIKKIGQKSGYIFQVINDLEPFCNSEHTIKYKGNLNSDVLKSRKSIVVPYLFGAASSQDKKQMDLYLVEGNFGGLKMMFDKYRIKQTIMEDIDNIFASIATLVNEIENCFDPRNRSICSSFSIFLEYLRKHYVQTLR